MSPSTAAVDDPPPAAVADDNGAREMIHRATAANKTVMGREETNRAYQAEYRRFNKWVRDQPALTSPILSVVNIEAYFSNCVAGHRGKSSTASKWVSAIQHYVDKEPKGQHLPPGFRLRENWIVALALASQKVIQKETGGTGNPGGDPHKSLKDNRRQADRNALMKYIYANRQDWGPAAVSFSWGLNAGVRGASNRSLTYCDINLSYGFAPPCANDNHDDGNHAALLLIICSGEQHKDRHETDQQVACWRHKRYKECSIFATAAHLVWAISGNNDINFKQPNKKARGSWWDIPLIDWEHYSETSNATEQIFRGAGVTTSTNKTHHRTAALQHGGGVV